jgi:hypothetical protein
MTDNKCCNNNGMCNYKTFGVSFGCAYSGYCDYQAPRDSRGWSAFVPDAFAPFVTVDDLCLCTDHRTDSAGRCMGCGRKKK